MTNGSPHFQSVDNAPSSDGLAPRPRVVVVGTGHGGMEVVKALRREPVDVILVDRTNFHKFQPLLYQVATAGLMPGQITQSARHIFRSQLNCAFEMETIVGVDFQRREILTERGTAIPYDNLVLAAGASTAHFGVQGAQEFGLPLKNVTDAIRLREHVLRRFEAANRRPDGIDEGCLDVVVVGGGATGVETAGAIIELFERVLARDFPAIDVGRARVSLIEMGDSLLSAYKPKLRDYAKRTLEKRGVDVRLDTAVERVTENEVRLRGGEILRCGTLVWAAGVRANPLADVLGVAQTRGGRVVVDEALRIPEHPSVFVVGDMAGATDPDGVLYPQVAQVAIQQGKHAAETMKRGWAGLGAEPFRYHDLGMMATIGRNAAVLQLPNGFTSRGFAAWLGWLFLHVLKLVGFRNRAGVFLSWVYNYVTYDRGPRLIFDAYLERDEAPLETGRESNVEPSAPNG